MWYGNGVLSTSLVLTGDLDLLVPPENCRLLAERIPGANLSVIPESGH
jgi:pimeloyl-ACP methyl ester carboxylesterase